MVLVNEISCAMCEKREKNMCGGGWESVGAGTKGCTHLACVYKGERFPLPSAFILSPCCYYFLCRKGVGNEPSTKKERDVLRWSETKVKCWGDGVNRRQRDIKTKNIALGEVLIVFSAASGAHPTLSCSIHFFYQKKAEEMRGSAGRRRRSFWTHSKRQSRLAMCLTFTNLVQWEVCDDKFILRKAFCRFHLFSSGYVLWSRTQMPDR